MLRIGDNVSHKSGHIGAIQHYGIIGKSNKPIKTSRKTAINSETPYVFVWFFATNTDTWVKLSDCEQAPAAPF